MVTTRNSRKENRRKRQDRIHIRIGQEQTFQPSYSYRSFLLTNWRETNSWTGIFMQSRTCRQICMVVLCRSLLLSPAVAMICFVLLSKSSSFIIELVCTQPHAKIIKCEKSKSISLSCYKSIFGCSILGMEVAQSQHTWSIVLNGQNKSHQNKKIDLGKLNQCVCLVQFTHLTKML